MERPANFNTPRFGAGLTEADVRRFQTILRDHCGLDIGLPEAWSRAIELLSLVEMLVQTRCRPTRKGDESTGFAFPRS